MNTSNDRGRVSNGHLRAREVRRESKKVCRSESKPNGLANAS